MVQTVHFMSSRFYHDKKGKKKTSGAERTGPNVRMGNEQTRGTNNGPREERQTRRGWGDGQADRSGLHFETGTARALEVIRGRREENS